LYGTHYGPHDLQERDWAHAAQTRVTTAEKLGIKFKVVPRVTVKATSIEAMRKWFPRIWIDQQHCSLVVSRFENYRKVWNKTLGRFVSDPLHDINSHCADAAQQGAMGHNPDPLPRADRIKNRRRDGTTAMSA